MDDGVDGVLLDERTQLVDRRVLRDVDLDEGHVAHPFGSPRAEVVDHHGVAAVTEQAHDVRADVAGSAGHENSHAASLSTA